MPKKLTYDDVKKYIELDGTKLLSKNFINVKSKLELLCHENHIYHMSLNNFQKGKRCRKCHINKIKFSYDFVKNYIELDGTKLISKEYKSINEKLELECPMGHKYKTKFYKFRKRGDRCKICSTDKMRNSYEDVLSFVENTGNKLKSKIYKNACTNLEFECINGHTFYTTYGNFQQGRRCKECPNGFPYSRGEKEIANYIKSIYNGTIIENDRKQIFNPKTGRYLELDIWLPELNKAVEYNSIYWHDDRKEIDCFKLNECKKLGIDLLIIDHNQWIKYKNYNEIKEFVIK